MGKKPSLIEINGQIYDASNGRLFHHPRSPVIDGFTKKPQPAKVIKRAVETFAQNSSSRTSAKQHPHKPAQTVHKRAERSKTLMRSVVKRPVNSKDSSGKSKIHPARTAAPKPSRLSRAMNMTKNSRVDRFGLPISNTKNPLYGSAKPANAAVAVGIANTKISSNSAAVAMNPLPSMVASASHQRLERMLDEALIRADAHKKALKGKGAHRGRVGKHLSFLPKWLTITIAAVTVVSIASYFAWSKVPYVSMKVASLRSHVQGSLPEYVPSGFKFAGTQHQPGNISMLYKAEGERSFTLEQQASSWDSSSLAANSIPDDAQIQKMQVRGTTVYIDSTKNVAYWVDNGKLNTIKGLLSPDEISKIANSIL